MARAARREQPGTRRPKARRAPTLGSLGEFGAIARIQQALRPTDATRDGVLMGIGDDTAVLDHGGTTLLLATVDMQVEGRHFLRARTPPETLGHRLGAVNLSDIAAMGGTPRWALVSLSLPKSLPAAWLDRFYAGLDAVLGAFGAVVVGGNLAGGARIAADLTLLGEAARGRLLTRAGAQPGDLLCVTGSLGRSAAGRAALDAGIAGASSSGDAGGRGCGVPEPSLMGVEAAGAIAAHLMPAPRVREGQALASAGGVHAMLDVSDGLAADLGHLCDASGVGVLLDAASLPIAADTRVIAARLDLDPAALALGGGEDFELLFCVAPPDLARARAAVMDTTGVPVTVIGMITPPEDGRLLQTEGGASEPLSARGWDHFRAPPRAGSTRETPTPTRSRRMPRAPVR